MEQVTRRGSVLGLHNVTRLLERLGNPQNSLRVIHIAGTNGKGSTGACLEGLYRIEGKRVGRYISPTITDYLERFQINGTFMEPQRFAQLLTALLPVIQQLEQEEGLRPTAFELETVLAFQYFYEEQVSLLLLETGMGGREDATNVVCKPLCTVFTSIGMDHMQFLGNTLSQIAWQKAGIMKPGCPVVTYPNAPSVTEVLQQEYTLINHAETQESTEPGFFSVSKSDIQILQESPTESRFIYKGVEYCLPLGGEYQIYNAATAIETKLRLDGVAQSEGLGLVTWPGRFEKLGDAPLFIRDGAHNVDGVLALRESLEKHFTNRPFLFIIGVLKDKEYPTMMQLLCPLAQKVFTITPPGQRGLAAETLRECILPYCSQVVCCDSVAQAVALARQEGKRNPETVIVAWGSLSYMGELTI
jgi:dihydrofolate synthase/folylpolyglutamate synthase